MEAHRMLGGVLRDLCPRPACLSEHEKAKAELKSLVPEEAQVWVRSANLQPHAVVISAINCASGFTSFRNVLQKRILNNKVATIGLKTR